MNDMKSENNKINASKQGLREIAEEYLKGLAPDIRAIIEDIINRIAIDLEGLIPTIQLKPSAWSNGDYTKPLAQVNIPKSLDDLNQTIRLLLLETGDFQKIPEDKRGMVLLVLTTVLTNYISTYQEKPVLNIEVKQVTEREEIYYSIFKHIMNQKIIKNFYVTTNISQFELGLYCFDGYVYRPCQKEVEKLVEELAGENEELDKKVIRWIGKEVIAKIRRKTLTPLKYEPLKIAFRNVIFDWEKFLETGSLRESVLTPSKDLVVFHKIPHKLRTDRFNEFEGLLKYDDRLLVLNLEELAEKLCPKTLKAFKDWVGDKWILLFEIIGYTLYPKYDMHKAIMTIGEGSNGKSTYLRLVRDILGRQNTTSVKLQDLTDNSKRFVIAELYHKLANIYPDLPRKALKDTGTFKALTGEDEITADRKHKEPIKFVNYAKLIFSANELPKVNDMTSAFWRRWIVIEFPNKFELNPSFYEETFTEEEIEGTIIISLLAFRNVWLRKKFSYEETEADYKEKWLRESNSVYAFIKDLLEGNIEGYEAVEDPNGKVNTDELYKIYVEYCNNTDKEPVSKTKFTQELGRLGYPRYVGSGHKYYKGIKVEKIGQINIDTWN